MFEQLEWVWYVLVCAGVYPQVYLKYHFKETKHIQVYLWILVGNYRHMYMMATYIWCTQMFIGLPNCTNLKWAFHLHSEYYMYNVCKYCSCTYSVPVPLIVTQRYVPVRVKDEHTQFIQQWMCVQWITIKHYNSCNTAIKSHINIHDRTSIQKSFPKWMIFYEFWQEVMN